MKKAGLKAFVFIWPFEADVIPARHKDDDTVLCYFLSDRVPQDQWGMWAEQRKGVQRRSVPPCLLHHVPQAFGGVDRFLPATRARVMDFYHYHWDADRAPQNYYLYLEQYRQASIKNGVRAGLPDRRGRGPRT